MKTLIVDDSKLNREGLISILENNFPILDIIGEANSVESSIEQIEKLNPELVFLDIELGDGTAFYLLNQLKHIDFSIIFITAYNKYAMEAFEVNAIDYILKPISVDKLQNSVKKVLQQQNNSQINQLIESIQKENNLNQNDFISIAALNEYQYIRVETILRLEADGKYTICVLADGKKPLVSSENIGKFEKEVSAKDFIRVHHSHLINRNYIQKFSKKELTVTMKNGDVIPISQRKKDSFFNAI